MHSSIQYKYSDIDSHLTFQPKYGQVVTEHGCGALYELASACMRFPAPHDVPLLHPPLHSSASISSGASRPNKIYSVRHLLEMCKGELIVGLSRHRDVHPTVRVRHHLNAKADGKIELGSLWNESSYLAESS
jgi:hypothetical protein